MSGVHFVIAMVLFSVFCDVLGFAIRRHRLFSVSFWNLVVASVSIFIVIIFSRVEASLAEPDQAVKPVLQMHTIIGGSLSAIVVFIQVFLGDKLVWVDELHTVPVVEAIKGGMLNSQVDQLRVRLGDNGLPYIFPIHSNLVHLTLGLFIQRDRLHSARSLLSFGKAAPKLAFHPWRTVLTSLNSGSSRTSSLTKLLQIELTI